MARRKSQFSIRSFIFNTQVLPIILSLLVLSTLFVLFRMKGVEQDYKFNTLNKKYKKLSLVNKELKADKAKSLSVKNLKNFARKHKLRTPSQKQIIVVP